MSKETKSTMGNDQQMSGVMRAHDCAVQNSDADRQWVAPLQPLSGRARAAYDPTEEARQRTLRPARMGSTSHVLLLDEDSTMVDALSRALRSSVPRLSVDTCATPDEARRRLVASPCHAIICSPTLTVAGGNSLLTCSRRVDPPVPFLLTIRRDEPEFASQWLDLGVYDFVFSPFQPNQLRESVEDALQLSKRRAFIARKQQALVYLRHRRERYQNNTPETTPGHHADERLRKFILRIQESTASLEQMAARIEKSLKRLQRTCRDNELRARQRALNRRQAAAAKRLGD